MPRKSIEQLCALIVDCPHKTAPPSADPFAYAVGTTSIDCNGRIDLAHARPVSEETYTAWTARAAPRAGDLILCREAPVGPVALVPSHPRLCLGQRTVLLRPNPDAVDPRWLAYKLRDPSTLAALIARSEGSTVAHVNVAEVRRFVVELPSLIEQRVISSVLGALDEKIDSNRRLVRLQRAARRERYGNTVKGVRARQPLAAIADLVKGAIEPSARPDTYFDQFSIPAFDAGEEPDVCLGASMASGKTPLPSHPVMLLSKLNPRTPRVWHPVPSGIGVPVCSPEFLVLSPKTGVPHSWLESCIRSDDPFYADLMSCVTGTTGSRQRVKPGDVLAATVPVISDTARAAWASFAEPLIAREAVLMRESRALAALRDALLPRLLSGRIRLPLSNDPAEGLGAAGAVVAKTAC
jgi:type I restriction enzyme S subunit